MSASVRTSHACARATGPRTWRLCATLPSIWCAAPMTNAASSAGASAPDGTPPTSKASSAYLPVNLNSLPWRQYGEPDQGVSGRSLCRPDLGSDHAGQPTAAVVRLDGLRPALRSAANRPPSYPVRRGHLRHDAPRAAEDRSPGPPIGPPHQRRYGLGASLSGRVRLGPCPIDRRPGLTNQTA